MDKIEKSLEEAAEDEYPMVKGLPNTVNDLFAHQQIAFKKGAEWQKNQIFKDAINGWLDEDNEPPYDLNVICEEKIPFGKFKHGDKVRIVVLTEEEE